MISIEVLPAGPAEFIYKLAYFFLYCSFAIIVISVANNE